MLCKGFREPFKARISFAERPLKFFQSAEIGIKIVNLHTNKLVKILGKVEQTERFLGIALYQGKAMKRKAGLGESVVEGENEQKESADPICIVTAYKKNR